MAYRTFPKRTVRRSGWILIGRARNRDYYSIVSPAGIPQGTYRTQALAIAAIRKYETTPLLESAQ